MISFRKTKRVANIAIDDYVIRMVENNGKNLASIKTTAEKALPLGLIEKGKITDELAFYDFMKEVVQEWGIKHANVRFYVPHDLIILRDIEIPVNVPENEFRQYITMEIGNTIHFPFTYPVFDLYEHPVKDSKKVTVIAAPEDEMLKYTEIMNDAKLKPVAVDAQPFGVYRYFKSEYSQAKEEKVYLLFEINLISVNISIFHQAHAEFLRYQPLNIPQEDWQADDSVPIKWNYTGDEQIHGEIEDQINELERLMNFYRFSIHRGEKIVNEILLYGDYPDLEPIKNRIEERYDLPVTILSTESLENEHQVNRAFIPALGLALRGRDE